MTENESPGDGPQVNADTPHARRRMLWIVGGAVAAVAVAGAAIAVPLLGSQAAPTAAPPAPSPSPSGTPVPPEPPAPVDTPSPSPVCTVTTSDLAWSDRQELHLPASGPAAADRVQRIGPADIDLRPSPDPFDIDDETFGIITANNVRSQSSLTVAGRDGEEHWTVVVDGRLSVLSSPGTTGVPGVVVVAVTSFEGDDHRMMSFDLATGDVLAERETGEAFPVTYTTGLWWSADVAPIEADDFFVSDREALSRVDAATLQNRWTVSGADFGVGQFEGGVPFDVTDDVVFVGPHAVDAATGESLGWESAGSVLSIAGATLQTQQMYERVGPFDLSGLDTTLGQACWTREVESYAATGSHLWILTPSGVIERIDPLTGQTLETIAETSADGITAAGPYLLAFETDPDDHAAPSRVSVFDGASALGEISVSSLGRLFVSGTQLVVHEQLPRELPTLTGYDAPGADPAWQIEETDLRVDAGVVLSADVDRIDNVIDYVLHH